MAELIDWLLDSDPVLRWQVQRDLQGTPEDVWRTTRARVSAEGFGARLLAHQDADGQWAGGAYFPGDFDWHNPHPDDVGGQPWIATTWSLNSLREWGVDAAALDGTAELLDTNARWEYDNLPYWGGEVDCCINGYTIANGAWLGAEVEGILDWFAEHRMSDGGWDCEWENGSTRSSFHSTLNALSGILAFEQLTGRPTKELRRPAEEYLLERGLFKRKATGEPVADWVFEFTYPVRWRYSVLKAGEYFRNATQLDSESPDDRMSEAIQGIRDLQQPDGTWLQARRDAGRVWFDVDVEPGRASKWITMSALRVLDWWDAADA